jgi:hypothetical protein
MQAQLKKLRAETTNREGIAKRATDKARLVWQAGPALRDFGHPGVSHF